MRRAATALALLLALAGSERAAALSPDPGQAQGFAALTGQKATVTGYVLPVRQGDGLVFSFALVPYAGACSHMPAPPAETVILVTPAEPLAGAALYEPVAVTGLMRMRPQVSRFFLIDGDVALRSNYAMSGAVVKRPEGAPPRQPFPEGSPWKGLHK